MRRWTEAAAALAVAAAGCVSFERPGTVVPDITGRYLATMTLSASNVFESRTDTFTAVLELRNAGGQRFTGSYAIAPDDSGPVAGSLVFDGSLTMDTLGTPPKTIGGVPTIRARFPWCDFTVLGESPVGGKLSGDTLVASALGGVPCLYQVNGTTQTVHTDLFFVLVGVR